MADSKFLTPDEVAERYRGGISVETLRNWRGMRLGPSFVKIAKAVVYPWKGAIQVCPVRLPLRFTRLSPILPHRFTSDLPFPISIAFYLLTKNSCGDTR